VGFDWDPRTKELWFTDNGRDMLGDETALDELNHAPNPICTSAIPIAIRATPPTGFRAQASVLGIRAARREARTARRLARHALLHRHELPAEYRNNIFIAEHGSWNRSKKIGYRVARVVVEGGRVLKHEVFAEGWLQGESGVGPSGGHRGDARRIATRVGTITRERFTASRTAGGSVLQKLLASTECFLVRCPVNKVWLNGLDLALCRAAPPAWLVRILGESHEEEVCAPDPERL